MTSGRKPTPAHLKLVGGSANPPVEASSDDIPSDPPAILDARGQYHWRQHVQNVPPGALKKTDFAVLVGYCNALSLWESAMAKVRKQGAMVKMKTAPQGGKNPWLSVADQQMQLLVRLGSELGFSPSSRTRVQATKRKRGRSALGALKDFKI